MILVYIENKELISKTITYLEKTGISYTTDLNTKYEYIIISSYSRKITEFINKIDLKNKKLIYLTYLDEEKIIKNKINEQFYNILKKCYKIIVSLPSIKNILKKRIKNEIDIIGKELPIINISKTNSDIYNKYNISKRKKKILLFDFDYNNINIIHEIVLNNPKYNFIYIGFKQDHKISEKDLNLLYNMPKNITFIKYYDYNILSDLTKISYLIINFEDINFKIEYLYMIFILKKQLLTKQNKLYEDYLINSKNCYIFNDNKELILRLNKILNDRVANLSDNGYFLIKDNTFDNIVKKYNLLIK
jgi:hypothetical protein